MRPTLYQTFRWTRHEVAFWDVGSPVIYGDVTLFTWEVLNSSCKVSVKFKSLAK